MDNGDDPHEKQQPHGDNQITVTSEGIYIGGTGKLTGATGTFTTQTSGSYLMSGFKDGVFGGFGQFTGTVESTLILPNGNGD